MPNFNEFSLLNKTAMDAVFSSANIALDSIKRLSEANFSAVKAAMEKNADALNQLANVKDLQGLASVQNSLAEPNVEAAADYFRSVYDIAAQTQSQFSGLLEQNATQLNSQVMAALEQAARSAPVGADAAVAAVKSAAAAASSAYDTLSKAAKQVADVAESNVNAFTAKAVAATRKKAA